jgi:glutamate/tyrosine decarboxylase-like PLP-dependent enzyme
MLTEASIPGMMGYLLGIRTGSNTVAREVSIFESEVEPEAIRGLAEMVGYDPDKADGTFTSGGSMAMQTALMAARRRIENEVVATTEHPFVVFGTQYTHYSVAKMCDIVAGPSKLVVKKNVGVEDFRMNPASLREALQNAKDNGDPVMAVVAIGGETETGVVDPISTIAEITEEFGVPMIVDGAYGAPYRLSRNSHLFEGMEKAFAITIDPHKALNTPYSNGAVLFRNGEDKYLGYGDRAGYLGSGANLGQKRIEGSMGAGPILSTLAVFRSLGKEGLATLYDMTLDRVEHLYDVVEKSPLLENLYYPELNLLCFTISPEAAVGMRLNTVDELSTAIDEIRKDLDEGIKGEGGYFFSATPLPLPDGQLVPVFRACLMNPRTTNADLDNAIKGLEKINGW